MERRRRERPPARRPPQRPRPTRNSSEPVLIRATPSSASAGTVSRPARNSTFSGASVAATTPADVVRRGEAGDENAVRAGVPIRPYASDRLVEIRIIRTQPVRVGARVDEQVRHATFHRADQFLLLRDVREAAVRPTVLDVDADRAHRREVERQSGDVAGVVAEATLDVDRDQAVQPRQPARQRVRLGPGLPSRVGQAGRGGHAETRRSDRAEARPAQDLPPKRSPMHSEGPTDRRAGAAPGTHRTRPS